MLYLRLYVASDSMDALQEVARREKMRQVDLYNRMDHPEGRTHYTPGSPVERVFLGPFARFFFTLGWRCSIRRQAHGLSCFAIVELKLHEGMCTLLHLPVPSFQGLEDHRGTWDLLRPCYSQ